jgi:hypothetical protein
MSRFSLLLAGLLLAPTVEAAAAASTGVAPAWRHSVLPPSQFQLATRTSALPGRAAFGRADHPWEAQTLARGGGGRGGAGRGGGGHGGGGHGGGGRSSERGGGRAQRANTGFDRAPRSFDRGNRTPSGGWSRDAANRPERARPSLDRPSIDRQAVRDRAASIDRQAVRDRAATIDRQAVQERTANLHRDDWNRRRDQLRQVDRNDWDRASDRIENGWNDRRDNLGNGRERWNNNLGNRVNRAYHRSNTAWPGWARPGWGLARPWNWGWYGGWSTPPWGWWGVRSVAWGLGSLASAVVINNAVNDAIAASQTTIVVPDSTDQLDYTSIEPSGDQLVGFVVYGGNGAEPRKLNADCRAGSLDGQEPASAAEAQLLNAVCQVAFGS